MRCSLPVYTLVVTLMTAGYVAADDRLPRVPDGFTIEVAAAAPLVKHPMMAGFDDRGRLFIAESAGENLRSDDLLKAPPNFIRMLEDTDGDGRFDKSTIFADKMTLPMGALWYRGALYVAAPPNIWRLEDTDGDGVADDRRILVDTFGFSGNAASVHGCFLGPDGRIYWCDGRHGHEFKDDDGKRTSDGLAARIFSCKPDGSDVQVFCGGGMDNPVEIDFTPEGEMFGTVNILLSRPRADALMHWVDGGAYPHHEKAVSEFKKTGPLLQPTTNLGHVAVSGMMRYRSDQFGSEYKNNIFITLFNTHKVIRSVLTRSGATFTTKQHEFLVSGNPDFHPTDVLEDADGSLLVIDTGGWFRIGCPVSKIAKPQVKGAIYRIRRKGGHRVEDPRGLKIGLKKMAAARLAKYLDDPRPSVQKQAIDRLAQWELDARSTLLPVILSGVTENPTKGQSVSVSDEFYRRAQSKKYSETTRRNAVWTLARTGMGANWFSLFDKSESVRLAAARAVGTSRNSEAVDKLTQMVVDETPALRRAAASALGRICEADKTRDVLRSFHPGEPPGFAATDRQKATAVKAMFDSVRKGIVDRILEHSLIYAVIRIADRDQTIPYLKDANPQVRRAALIALDQMDDGNLTRELVTPLLDTDDPALQREALAVISKHDGWASETLRLIRAWLSEPGSANPDRAHRARLSVLRGFLLAQSSDQKVQQLVAESLTRGDTSPGVRLLLLEVLHRAVVEPFPASWQEPLQRALVDADARMRLQAVRIIQSRGLPDFDAALDKLAVAKRQPAELRVEALLALAPRLKSLDDRLFRFLLDRLTSENPPLLRLAAARALAAAALDTEQLIRLAKQMETAGPLAAPVLLRAFSQSQSGRVGRTLLASLNGSAVVESLAADELARLLRSYPQSLQTDAAALLKRLGADPEKQRQRLQQLTPLLTGGDPDRGRAVFAGKKAACISCHSVAAHGGRVGPDLTKIGSIRTGVDLVEALAFPSASFAREFRTYLIVTDAGKVHTGVISRQTADAVYLRTAELAEIRIPHSSIDEMKESSTSIMPKGLDKTLSAQELRDLLSYLQRLK